MSNRRLISARGLSPDQTAVLIDALIDALQYSNPMINPEVGKGEPPSWYKVDGFTVYANGTDWDPGSGKGFYRWNSATSAWVFVG